MVTNYPWATLKPGEGFFVPALDLQKEKERGLAAALPYIRTARAIYGIKDGLMGVWFFRPATQSSKTVA